jgi:hypothetical protein
MAESGAIGGWAIDGKGLSNDSGKTGFDVFFRAVKTNEAEEEISSAYVGTDGTGQDSSIAVFKSKIPGIATNKALYAEASGSTSSLGDIAAHFVGQILIDGGIQILRRIGIGVEIYQGKSMNVVYKGGQGENRHLKVINGLIVDEGPGVGP